MGKIPISRNHNWTSRVDSSTEALIGIDYEHHEVHGGSHFFGCLIDNFTGGDQETKYYSFVTPDSEKQVHARFATYGSVEFVASILEGANEPDSDGSIITALNNFRDSTNTADMMAYQYPVWTEPNVVGGTQIWSAATGANRSTVGVSPGFNYEIIAKRNTRYVFKILKNTVATGWISLDFYWYEHTPKW